MANSGHSFSSVRVFNSKTKKRHVLQGHCGEINSIAFCVEEESGEGYVLVSASHDGTVRRWHLEDEGRQPQRTHDDSADLVSSEGSYAMT